MGEAGSPRRFEESSAPLMAQNDQFANVRLIPQLFASVPSLDEAASYLAQTTSLITRCFSDYSVDHPWRDYGDSTLHARELVTFSSWQPEDTQNGDHPSTSGNHSVFSDSFPSATATPYGPDRLTRSSSEGPSQSSSALAQPNSSIENGISLFQGYCPPPWLVRDCSRINTVSNVWEQ